MRCIEMNPILSAEIDLPGLTLTWDVLKYKSSFILYSFLTRLTLTWDVLKYVIETLLSTLLIWLTLTWDVLKCKGKNTCDNTI